MTSVSIRDRRGGLDTDTERTAVRRQKQGVIGPKESLEAGDGKEGAPPRAWERKRGPADTLRFIWISFLNSSSFNHIRLPMSLPRSTPSRVPRHLKDKVQVPYVPSRDGHAW